ncbi:MAG TPA: MFS transporter [Chitinophagaceae bacterium]|nr:MFS transporter [Chitinophagaceae bacterium]
MEIPNTGKPKLSFWQIWNMSFGFLGIQFGFALQNTNVSRIFQTLGAKPENLSWYWLAAPVTGLLVQPVIGYLSDRTWHVRWGRRKPYFFTGSVMAALALLAMPNARILILAIFILWIMDASINISMEPFRAFVGDMLPRSQHTSGFAMQTFFIGCGAVVASLLPFAFTHLFKIPNIAAPGIIPLSVKYSFYTGGLVFLAAVLWTVFNSREKPPEDLEDWKRKKQGTAGLNTGIHTIVAGIWKMPRTMAQLAVVQFFTWTSFFSMWIFTTPAVAENVFHTHIPASRAYQNAGDWVGVLFAVYNAIPLVASFLLPGLARKIGRTTTHMGCLVTGGIGLISMLFLHDKYVLILPMIGIGLAWASTLTMPYAILAGALPAEKMGFYMGVFNFFIVIPQIITSILLGFLVRYVFHGLSIYVLVLGGISMIIAGIMNIFVDDRDFSKGVKRLQAA